MPRVIITQYTYVSNNETALRLAQLARGQGKRSEIISDDEYLERARELATMQDLRLWARDNSVKFSNKS